jgi:hypothetical protein
LEQGQEISSCEKLTFDPDDTGLHFVVDNDETRAFTWALFHLSPKSTGLHFVHDNDETRAFTWALFHLSPKSSFWSRTSLSMLAPFAKGGQLMTLIWLVHFHVLKNLPTNIKWLETSNVGFMDFLYFWVVLFLDEDAVMWC